MDLEDLPFPRMVVASDGKIYTPDNHILFVLRKLCLADEDVPMVPLPMTPAIQAAVDALPPVSSSHVEKTTTNSYYHHIKVDKKLRKAQNVRDVSLTTMQVVHLSVAGDHCVIICKRSG